VARREVTRRTAAEIAELASLRTDRRGLDDLAAQLERIAEWLEILAGLDLRGVRPWERNSLGPCPLADDLPSPGPRSEEIMIEASRRRGDLLGVPLESKGPR
jgi:Asp-tRNA(Asn)/Glu-tRNA(Gln) amidotransferase C subunit